MYKDILGNSFLFSPGDATWKAKRQACAHAFYKDRLMIMTEVLREKIEAVVQKWIKAIESSEDKSYLIDITVEFERVFARNLIHIAFGEDINDNLFDLDMRRTKAGKSFVKRKVTMAEALNEVNECIITSAMTKMLNPLAFFFLLTT